MSTRDPVLDLLAYEQIRQLAHRYALAVDSRNMDELVELYVEDVKVGSGRGRALLRALFEEHLGDLGITIGNVGTHVIDLIDHENAMGWCYASMQLQQDDRWIVQAVLYRDRYARRDGHWYFAGQRRHHLWYGAPVGVNPLDLGANDWPRTNVGMGDAPAKVFPSWPRFRSGA